MTESRKYPPGGEPTRPCAIRMYDYFLGGTLNYQVDREAADKLKAAVPDIVDAMWANRGFHGRAAVWMADHGIRQFIDVGSVLPTQNNTHQAVHKVSPDAKVVYVGKDPEVTAHPGPLPAGDGSTAVITAHMRDPDALLADPRLRRLIDSAEPTGVLMTAMLHFMPDEEDPWGLVARYMAAVAPGSYLALSHGTADNIPPALIHAGLDAWANAGARIYLRQRADVERFFTGLELVPPYAGAGGAVTYAGLWGAEDLEAADTEGSRGIYCGVARRP
jgi:S-adenosyl methyltransferase